MLLEHILMMNPGGNINFEIKEVKEKIIPHDKDSEKEKHEKNETIKNKSKEESKEESEKDMNKNKETKKNRCMKCNKKLKLTDTPCKCGHCFCNEHRYSDRHDCKFDYKKLGKDLLEKNNPTVVSSKVDKL